MSAATFTVEGRWAVEALLDSRFDVDEVIVEQGRHSDLIERLPSTGVSFRVESREILSGERGYPFHRGVYAVARRPVPVAPDEAFLRESSKLVIPLGLADPGNLGTIIRSAVAFGADGILLEKGSGADVFNAKCIRASATALFRVPLFEVESIEASLSHLKEAGFAIFGTSLREGATELSQTMSAAKCAVLLGGEEEGLPSSVEDLCDERVHIPMANGMDSLNVAATAAILFYELFR